ncbi:MAG: DUF1080 domain-containing protein, partial [Sphingobacteriales bacterium]
GLNKDPKHVFRVVKENGEKVIRISGESWGGISTKAEYKDFHLQLKFKWGALSWGQKKNKKKDSGLLYFATGPHGADYGAWMRSQEFQLEEGNTAAVPTALGNKDQVILTGMLGDSPVRLETPQGINMETVAYPYLQGSVGLWYGTEVVVKYSPHVKLKKSDYQVYGFGLKHNISRYFKSLKEQKIHIAVLAAYSKEDISFNFLNVQTDYGSLGINKINGLVDTWQFQLSASQEFWDNLEFMGSFLANTSDVRYRVTGDTGGIEEIIPLQSVLNTRLREIYKTRINYIGEFGTTYKLGNFNVQAIVAFGKFVNTNVSLQYLFK